MRSSRLAVLAVAAGAALLGWSTVGVAAIGGQLSAAAPAVQQQQLQQPAWHRHDDVDLDARPDGRGHDHHDVDPGV
jgi:hypothetical protein